MDPDPNPSVSLFFGRFQVLPHCRVVLADGQPLRLGGRAFDVLMALIEARGVVVGKDMLMARVWPDRDVEENALQVQITALRAAFGPERSLIRTVSGRGYQFTGEISTRPSDQKDPPGRPEPAPGSGPAMPPTNLPAPVSELIGRDDELHEVIRVAALHRLVTLTGSGGIGKTRLALATARKLLPDFADGVWIVELAPLADPSLVPAAIAASLGLEIAGATSPESVATALRSKQILLVLDNCEHVIDAAATVAAELARACLALRLIATSREPLNTDGEWVYPVPPLGIPAEHAEGDGEPLQYGAVRLFLERARAANLRFALDRRQVSTVATICRRLDGIPLALELAAARVAAIGIEELAIRLDDRFRLLTAGRRTALPRHQTLRATLDWSFELLPESERTILRRLSVFAGSFTLEGLSAVVVSADLPQADVLHGLVNLVAKSLLISQVEGTAAAYRLLETTRLYAMEKLEESGERERVLSGHAAYYRDLLERAESELAKRPPAEWLAEYGKTVDNLRAALDWAFSPHGDASIGMALTAAAVPLWSLLSLIAEFRTRAERALAILRDGASVDARLEMKLRDALASTFLHITGPVPELFAAWAKALELAERLEDPEYQLRALWGLCFYHTVRSERRLALALAQQVRTLAASLADPNDRLLGDLLVGISLHFLGDQVGAGRHIEGALTGTAIGRRDILRFQTDQRVLVNVYLSRVLWLQGFPEQAMRTVESSLENARAANHTMSLCYALALSACVVTLWVGDLEAAEACIAALLDNTKTYGLDLWHAFGRGYRGVLAIERGDIRTGLSLLGTDFAVSGAARLGVRPPMLLGHVANGLSRIGRFDEALGAIDGAIAWCEQTETRWPVPDFLRIKAELLLLQDAPDAAAAAEDHLEQALSLARQQGARSWELRVATSLARLLRDQGRSAEAKALLQPVYSWFTEGFDTADLKMARAFLDAVPPSSGREAHEAAADQERP